MHVLSYMIFLVGLHTCINLVSKGCKHFGQHEDAYLTYHVTTVLQIAKKNHQAVTRKQFARQKFFWID